MFYGFIRINNLFNKNSIKSSTTNKSFYLCLIILKLK